MARRGRADRRSGAPARPAADARRGRSQSSAAISLGALCLVASGDGVRCLPCGQPPWQALGGRSIVITDPVLPPPLHAIIVPTLFREQRALELAQLASGLVQAASPMPYVVEVAVAVLVHASLYRAGRAAAWAGYVTAVSQRDDGAAAQGLAGLLDGSSQ